MNKPKDEGSKSISPPDINDALERECPHCAMNIFLSAWIAKHHDTSTRDVIGAMCEVITDILASSAEKKQLGPLALQAFLELSLRISDILAGDYKTDTIDAARAKREGGVH